MKHIYKHQQLQNSTDTNPIMLISSQSEMFNIASQIVILNRSFYSKCNH